MKRRFYIAALIVLLGFAHTKGQVNPANKYLKVYLTAQYSDETSEIFLFDQDQQITEEDVTDFQLAFSPALGFRHRNGSRSEIEIKRFGFKTRNEINLIEANGRRVEGKTKSVRIALRYQYDVFLTGNDRLGFFLGAAVTADLDLRKLLPESEYLYETKNQRLDLSAALVPGLVMPIGQASSLNVNIPVSLIKLSSISSKYQSSVVPSGKSKFNDGFSTALPPLLELRIGLEVAF